MKQYFDRNGVKISAGDILHYEYFKRCNGAYKLVGANVLPVSNLSFYLSTAAALLRFPLDR